MLAATDETPKESKKKKQSSVVVSKKWNILAITYNVANRPPNRQTINQILETTMKNTDLSFVIISLQEIRTSERFGMHWNDTWRELFHMALWELGFMCICSSYMITNLLMVFGNRTICQIVDSCRFTYSKDYYNGAKGTISVLVRLRGGINFLFLGSHFAHALEQVARRVVQVKNVRDLIRLVKRTDTISALVWAGDLNFRTTDAEAESFAAQVLKQKVGTMPELVEKHDQLAKLRDVDVIFNFFDEAPIHFRPSYRFIIDTNTYDAARVPSWTDRILFDNLRSTAYNSIWDCCYSDHQPVYSLLNFEHDKAISAGWEIEFHEINAWYVGVPLHISFKGKDFWKRNGSYRDWLGVYKVPNVNNQCAITFTNIMLVVDYGTHYLAEFMSLPVGQYIVAYHSYNDGVIKGLSNVFTVTEFT